MVSPKQQQEEEQHFPLPDLSAAPQIKTCPPTAAWLMGRQTRLSNIFFCFAIHNYPLSFYPPLSDDPNSALDDAKSELFTFCASQKTKIKFLDAEKRMQRRKSLSSRVQTAENMRDLKRERWMHASFFFFFRSVSLYLYFRHPRRGREILWSTKNFLVD